MNEGMAVGSTQPFGSLAELRAEHLTMLRSWRTLRSSNPEVVVAFRNRIAATGLVLDDDEEREAAQGLLEYWGAQLLSTDDAGVAADLDFQLEAHDPNAALGTPTPVAPAPVATPQTEASAAGGLDLGEQIRLNALARQWRESGRTPSYLLAGAALAKASIYRNVDPDIEAFVVASERRVRARKARWTRRITLAALAALTVIIAAGVGYSLLYIEKQAALQRYSRLSVNVSGGTPIKGQAPAAEDLLPLTYLIDGPDQNQSQEIVGSLIAGLKKGALPTDIQVRAVDSLVGNLMHPSVDGLSTSGLNNLLDVLAQIPKEQWLSSSPNQLQGTGWAGSRAGARRAVANLGTFAGGIRLGPPVSVLVDELATILGLRPPPAQQVAMHFADATINAADVRTAMQKLGWSVDIAPAEAVSALVSGVHYGDSADTEEANTLAADLSKCGFKLPAPTMTAGIPTGTLDVWLTQPSLSTQSCLPATSPAP
jgi:hypothetical protein